MDFSRTPRFISPLDDIKKDKQIIIDGAESLRSEHESLQALSIPATSRWVGNVPLRSIQPLPMDLCSISLQLLSSMLLDWTRVPVMARPLLASAGY